MTLLGITKRFNLLEVEKYLRETVPIKAPDFAVYLNGHKITPQFIAGRKLPFLEGTEFGTIYGEVIITSSFDQDIHEAGIECKVKQVTITKEFFGLQNWMKNISRIRGEVHGDFLPITSDRSGFIKDTPQYKKFQEVMEKVIERIKPIIEELTDYRENKRVRRTLTEVLDRVRTALILNPDYCPQGLIPLAEDVAETGQPGYVAEARKKNEEGQQKKETPLPRNSAKENAKEKPIGEKTLAHRGCQETEIRPRGDQLLH